MSSILTFSDDSLELVRTLREKEGLADRRPIPGRIISRPHDFLEGKVQMVDRYDVSQLNPEISAKGPYRVLVKLPASYSKAVAVALPKKLKQPPKPANCPPKTKTCYSSSIKYSKNLIDHCSNIYQTRDKPSTLICSVTKSTRAPS
jgi:hypothetical protein